MNPRNFHLLTAWVSLLFVTTTHAQLLELKATNSNWLFAPFTAAGNSATPAGPPTGSNQSSEPVTANSAFRGMGLIGGSSGANLGTFGATTSSYTFKATDYPSNARYSGSTVTIEPTVALGRSTIGGAFASGAPRFSMGEVITEPLAKADNVTTAPEGYWRSKPVEPGEVFSDQSYTVNVTNSSTSSSTVTVASVPTGVEVGSVLLGQRIMAIAGTTLTLAGNASNTYLTSTAVTVSSKMPNPAYTVSVKASSNTGADANKVTVVAATAGNLSVGSTLLGQPIIAISGDATLVTLAGDANQAIFSSTGISVPVTPPLSYYYSPHADVVYASQPGRVSIIWVSLVQESGSYKFKDETFAVATSTSKPVRKIFWTEGSFDGPTVSITDGRVSTVNPIYNANVPKAVANEVSVPGYTPMTPNLKTLYFQRVAGTGEIRAYNVEGRMLIEYLGQVRAGNNVYTSLGVDVVDLVRSPTTYLTTTHLGQPILPHDAVNGSTSLTAIPKSVPLEAGGGAYYSTEMQSNGVFKYVAERETGAPNRPENGNPLSADAYNKVAFYWAEAGDYGAKWPKFQNSYWLRWSPNLSDYVINTVGAAGSTTDNGLQFTDGLMPTIVYQDDPAQAEAQIDSLSQRLRVTFAENSGGLNRALLKFTGGTESWYVNLYSQAETRSTTLSSTSSATIVTVASTANLRVGMTVTGSGITGSATIVEILDGTRYLLSTNIGNSTSAVNFVNSLTLSATIAAGSTQVTTATTSGLVAGMLVSGTGIPAGATIASITDATRYELSAAATSTGTFNLNHIFGTRISSVLTSGSTTVTIASTSGLVVGMPVSGTNIPTGATIASITNATSYVLSVAATGTTTTTLTYTSLQAATYSTGTSTITMTAPNTTSGLVAGMTVSDANGNFLGTILSITDTTHYVLSNLVANTTANWTYTVEDGGGARIFNSAAMVGTRIDPPAGYQIGGYISGGTGYYPSAYVNPVVSGVVEANKGAIIPVNAKPGNDVLTVRWFKKIEAPSASFKDQYIPGKIGTYRVSYPANLSQIVIAQGVGSGDLIGAEAAGSIYVQNDVSKPGYNPNEEHALIRAGRAYALREDLNIYSTGSSNQPASGYSSANYTSEPYVLVAYTDAGDQRPQMRAYQVVRSNGTYDFRYTATAGTLLSKPYPLPLLPLAMTGSGATLKAKDIEIHGADAPINTNGSVTADSAYKGFTFQDRKGFTWVHRGPHGDPVVRTATASASTTVTVSGGTTAGLVAGMSVTGEGITGGATIVSITNGTSFVLSKSVTTAGPKSWTFKPALSAKLYYTLQAGFFIPGIAFAEQPPEGTVLPFLRNANRSGIKLDLSQIDANPNPAVGDELDAPLQIVYEPTWPMSAPELRVGETLALPSRGLPQVRGQQSAQILYQQSIAKDSTNTLDKNSVTLFDPTCQKTVEISTCGMTKLPSSIATSAYKGKTYFQKLPPDLQQRLYFDPLLSSTPNGSGSLVFTGVFHEEITGDSYFDLNAFSPSQEAALLALVPEADADRANWVKAVRALKKRVETYYENPSKLGTYIPNPNKFLDVYASSANSPVIAAINDPDTRVDSYALTATGRGTGGYVTMVFNNGKAFTDAGNPVSVEVFKIANQLYPGELKVISSSNPLDEQVALRHTADFAGRPDDYEYDWRYTDGAPSTPATYRSVMTPRIGNGATPTNILWTSVSDPGAMLPTAKQYSQLGKSEELGSGARSVSPYPRAYLNSGISNFTLIATKYEGTTVSVADTSQLMAGMSVTGGALSSAATIVSIKSRTDFVLSQSLSDATDMALTFTAASNVLDTIVVTPTVVNGTGITLSSSSRIENGMRVTWPGCDGTATVLSGAGSLELVLTQAPPARTALTFQATSLTDDEIAAGYPGLVLKSNNGLDFSAGVPRTIVFSATLGDLDGCVLYVNGKAAMAYNAPSPQFSSLSASTGLTLQGLSKQFSIEPGYFTKGVNTIEVAVYTVADPNGSSEINFKLEAAQETDLVTSLGTVWQKPVDFDPNKLPDGADRTLTNTAIIGGSTSNPFGGAQFVLNDRWFTMRYRPKASTNNSMGIQWSNWTTPQFTEGWVKRVLAAINPFSQRVKDLYNNAVNTDVSMITQAGTRWEGDLALNMENINDNGLIAIYETVLNRAKSMSIDANTNDKDTNNALLLAAGYLNDLYTILGNEASADAADSTIALDTFRLDTGAVASSRFSFEAQVASSLDEEMSLLRGRDDSVSPGVMTKPFYNRLVWNYTRGINSGEAIYASNYNIKEKVGSSTANGVIDAADAQRMFPQGHGDAYGHYLTALKGYYRLLWNPNFTWTPSAEAVTVLGVPVTVDFQDERKFAAAAAHLARTAEQICALTYRQNYKDDPKAGWSQFEDKVTDRGWALDEQVSRSTQGALFNWTVANALLPDEDKINTGVQKIDRTTVLELALLPTAASSLQTTLDNANARLNPLGLSPGAIPFDIDPGYATSLGQEQGRAYGRSQFLQMYDRSLRALNNAAGAFSQAASMSRALRDQINTVDDYAASIAQQEFAFNKQLCEIYGTPYTGDLTYSSEYTGPDLFNYFIVDRPNDLVDTSKPVSITIEQRSKYNDVSDNQLAAASKTLVTKLASDILPILGSISKVAWNEGLKVNTESKTVNIYPSSMVQYNDVWQNGGMGSRRQTGELQQALVASQQSLLRIREANNEITRKISELKRKSMQYNEMIWHHTFAFNTKQLAQETKKVQELAEVVTKSADETSKDAEEAITEQAKATAETLPKVVGPLAFDPLAPVRGTFSLVGVATRAIMAFKRFGTKASQYARMKIGLDAVAIDDKNVLKAEWSIEEGLLKYELVTLLREVTTQEARVMSLAVDHQLALENINNVIAKGNSLLLERELFRQRAAAIVQGYRTNDMTFRTFRNEALEQYRSLYDLASRYTYMAAKAYDYETGLLGTTQGQKVFSRIVASRSLGDLTGGTPQATTSTLGDAGLAGTMAQLDADFSVAESRLGINNPDYYGTVFSLRGELFRLLDEPGETSDDDAWRQTLEQHIVSNVLNDSDVASQCLNIKKSNGSAVPGIIIPFSSSIESSKNFFGKELAAYDHAYSVSSFATVISNAGMVLSGYVGMDSAVSITEVTDANRAYALSATPYVYLIPCGNDVMRAPPLGDTDTIRTWTVQDQALPLPYNLGANDFNSTQFFNATGTLSSKPWVIRKHQAFRAVANPDLFVGAPPLEFSSARLIGRSAWNTRWKIVIPANTLSANEQDALNRFVSSVTDIKLYLRTYSHSGN